MDSTFAIQGKDFVLVAADCSVAYSILKFQDNHDKSITIDNNKILCMGGPNGDRVNFGEFIKNNIHLYKFRNNHELDVNESAEYIRSELAKAIRKAPMEVQCIVAGFDHDGPQLYWVDYMGTKIRQDRSAQGYAGAFLYGLLDNVYKKDITMEEGIQIMKYCINELQTRFLMSQNNFIIKCVDKDGVRVL